MEDKDGEEEEVGLELIVNNADEEEAEEGSEVEPLCRFPRIVGEVIEMPSDLWIDASPQDAVVLSLLSLLFVLLLLLLLLACVKC